MAEAIGIGAGGHAKVVVEIIHLVGKYQIAGLLDSDERKLGSLVCGVKVLGDDSLLPQLFSKGMRHAFMSLGSLGSGQLRKELYEHARTLGFEMISAVHPQAVVSRFARLGIGSTIMASAIINPGTMIGENVIINSGAIVDHDCVIGDHVHVASGACLSGGVIVGGGSHIGAGAVVRQGISIGENSIVGAGAVVVRNVPDNVTVVGVPARIHERQTV
jgi:sugar O-acyltransferase (sialic acid O-acetyltransferase NeuD family)